MRFIEGDSREQLSLLPEAIDDLIPADHLVRVIDAFVDKLDLGALGFTHALPAATGRKPYDPGDLLKLYLYGYLNQVQSSRRLEHECQRNVELWWLLGRLAPDFKTIADFRRDNGAAIIASGRAFIEFCQRQGLLSRRVALDGSKFKSAGSLAKSYTRKQIQQEQRQLRAYLSQLEQADAADHEAPLQADRVQAALSELAAAEQVLAAEGRNTISLTDADARLMRSGRAGLINGYNVQAGVDEGSGVVVHHEVSQHGADNRQLEPMAKATQAALGDEPVTVVADAGYSNGAQLQACEDAGITPLVPANRAVNTQGQYFGADAFEYDARHDVYRCPAGESLPFKTVQNRKKHRLYHREDCTGCALKDQCTGSRGRWLSRHFHEDAFERARQRLDDDPGAMKRRMATVEPVFGTLKRRMGGGRFSCWGLSGVVAELGLHVLAHNLQRIINLKGGNWVIATLATP